MVKMRLQVTPTITAKDRLNLWHTAKTLDTIRHKDTLEVVNGCMCLYVVMLTLILTSLHLLSPPWCSKPRRWAGRTGWASPDQADRRWTRIHVRMPRQIKSRCWRGSHHFSRQLVKAASFSECLEQRYDQNVFVLVHTAGFECIIRQNLLSLCSSWGQNEQLRKYENGREKCGFHFTYFCVGVC